VRHLADFNGLCSTLNSWQEVKDMQKLKFYTRTTGKTGFTANHAGGTRRDSGGVSFVLLVNIN
jgi:hypothetical protein